MKLENKTVEELKNMCRNKKISGYSKLNKQGLVNLLNNNKKVKKGGGNKSFNDLKVGEYYKCESSPYRNENAYYVGKLISKTKLSAEFHRYEKHIIYNNNPNNIYTGESPYTTRGVYYFNLGTFNKKDKLFTEVLPSEVKVLGFEVWNNKGGSKSNKKGGYVPYHWLTPMNFNYRSNNGITKNNLAGNYFYAFVPFQVYSSLDLMNFKINNESNYPKINMMIFDYLFGYGLSENKEKVYKIIKDYIPAKTLNKEGKNNQGKKAICTWWCLDSNLNFQQRKGTYIDSNIYSNFKPQLKKGLPLKFTDYDGFIIIETSDWI